MKAQYVLCQDYESVVKVNGKRSTVPYQILCLGSMDSPVEV